MRYNFIVKKLVVLALVLCLLGCTNYSDDLNGILNQKIEYVFTLPADKPNYNHKYYSYYLEPSVGRITSSETSNTFNYMNHPFVLNLNVSGIISSSIYPNTVIDDLKLSDLNVIAQKEGEYTNYDEEVHPYHVNLYQLKSGVLVLFHTDTIDFYSISDKYTAVEIVQVMMRIARSIHIDKDLVLSTFSRQQVISNKKETIQLFQNLAPESGVIEQLFVEVESVNQQSTGIYTTGDEIMEDGQTSTGKKEKEDKTEKKEEAEVKEDTETPEATEEPEATEVPEETPVPEETVTPEETVKPEETQTPVESSDPVESDNPEETEEKDKS